MPTSPKLAGAGSRSLDGVLAVARSAALNVDGLLAPDVLGWFASPAEGIAAGIESVTGAEETVAALSRLAPSTLTVVEGVFAGRASWAEVRRQTADEVETCIVGCREDAGGSAVRLVWVRALLVPPAEVGHEGSIPEAGAIMQRYFDDLQDARFRDAAENFTEDTIYSHPPYGGGAERVLYVGRDALWNGFRDDRGESPVRQVITGLWQKRSRVFVEGVIEGVANGGTFLSTAQITGQGKIARYVAFYSSRRLVAAGGCVG
jgi:hypothetical protein